MVRVLQGTRRGEIRGLISGDLLILMLQFSTLHILMDFYDLLIQPTLQQKETSGKFRRTTQDRACICM